MGCFVEFLPWDNGLAKLMADASPKTKESPKSRMWTGLLGAFMFSDMAGFAIFRHELIGRRTTAVTPLTGAIWAALK